MRAVIIDSDRCTITEQDIEGSPETLKEIVGGPIEWVSDGLDGDHHCYINQEALTDKAQHFFKFNGGKHMIPGTGIILSSTDDDDGEAPCTLSLDWVKERVGFFEIAAEIREQLEYVTAAEVTEEIREQLEYVTAAEVTDMLIAMQAWVDAQPGIISQEQTEAYYRNAWAKRRERILRLGSFSARR